MVHSASIMETSTLLLGQLTGHHRIFQPKSSTWQCPSPLEVDTEMSLVNLFQPLWLITLSISWYSMAFCEHSIWRSDYIDFLYSLHEKSDNIVFLQNHYCLVVLYDLKIYIIHLQQRKQRLLWICVVLIRLFI